MYTKQNLIESVSNEFRIIKHLATKIPTDTKWLATLGTANLWGGIDMPQQ